MRLTTSSVRSRSCSPLLSSQSHASPGGCCLRTLLIHGARAVLYATLTQHKRGHTLDRFHAWALEVAARRGHNTAAMAVANKLARRLWAMTRDGKPFDGDHISVAPAMR